VPAWFTFWLLALDGLAVFRLTRFITEDHVPFGPVRDRITERRPDSLLAEWVSCPWCAGTYVALVVLALHALLPAIWPYAAAVLAFSATAGLLATWEQRD
jgi:hypothetical protein